MVQPIRIIQKAMNHQDAIAVSDTSSQRTYRELLDRSASVAKTLLGEHADLNEARIAQLLPAGFDYIASQWGVWRAGGISVPLSLSATGPELAYVLNNAQASCVITNREFADRLKAILVEQHLRCILVEELVDTRDDITVTPIGSERRAMILYTSGTTSQPKGVVTTHANIEAQIESLVSAWHWQSDDRLPLFLPLHHVHGIINVMSCALWTGATVEPFPRFEVDTILRRVAAQAYSVFMAVPTIYVKLIEGLENLSDPRRSDALEGFRRMRLMVSGSAALPAGVHRRWADLTGQSLLERYGMTEIGMALSNPYDGDRRPGAVGIPLPNVSVKLRSEKRDIVAGEGIPGEILVRGPTVFKEYWNRPEATQQAFHDGWFATGDIALIEDGYYRIMGRNSVDIIKSGGYKISALEIEAVLLDHPSISECAVVGVEDVTWGQIVSAAIVAVESTALDIDALRCWCRDRLSTYKIPRQFLMVEELPRNAMGKVVKPQLKELFQQ